MKPTEEQQLIIDHNMPPGSALKVVAYAGAGKTSTLCEVARRYPSEECLYLAFNKSVEQDAVMKFPSNTLAKTGHAFAYQHIGCRYRGGIANLYNWQLAKAYSMSIYEASLLLKSFEAYCCSADLHVCEHHIHPDFLSKLSPLYYVTGMVDRVAALWEDMTECRYALPMTHSCYLKMFQLSTPTLPFGVILLDEAQDTNPVMHDIVFQQAAAGARVYLVGDPYQQIYSWRGAVDAMSRIDAPTLRLSQSFRFGDSVAALASRLLELFFNESVPLRGNPEIESSLGPVSGRHTVLTRTNAELVSEAYHTATRGESIHVVGEAAFQQVISDIDDVFQLWSGRPHAVQQWRIKMHGAFGQLKVYAEETMDVELASKIRVVENFTTAWPDVREAILSSLQSEAKADIRLSTTHKAKGLEWPKVRLAPDFEDLFYAEPDKDRPGYTNPRPRRPSKEPKDETEVYSEEINLLYVALTRAQERLMPTHDLSILSRFEHEGAHECPA